MERRRNTGPNKTASRIDQQATGDKDSVLLPLPHIAELMECGGITVGQMDPVGCVAIANTEDGCLTMLRRRKGETLAGLLTRLDQAIAKAFYENIYTDEINSPS
jgi:hypothetical protein